MKIFVLTTLALICFALNSILCRLALGGETIDAVSFTAIRLISGAAALLLISQFTNRNSEFKLQGNWISAFCLFSYAICFSIAYMNLTTATGALILFSAVQLTMISIGLFKGERPGALEWVGLILAFGGLVYLIFPGLAAPPILNASLMVVAGASWGIFTLRGRDAGDAIGVITGNFTRTVPMIILAAIPFIFQSSISSKGALLAILSGALASGLGYVIWYSVLRHHTTTRAAIMQLSVPVLAAIGGVMLLSEAVSFRLVISSLLILSGIGLAVSTRSQK